MVNDLVFDISELKWPIGRRAAKTRAAILLMCLPVLSGCSEFFRNQSASLGGDQAGDRGTIRVLYINNTPHRAVFTHGTYDQGDPDFQPDFEQFGPLDQDLNLDGNSSSAFRPLACGRVFAIGSDGLRTLLEDDATVIDEAVVEGVEFYDVGEDGNASTRVGAAEPLEALLGLDFACNGLLVIYLEAGTEAGAFRIDYHVIPAESDR